MIPIDFNDLPKDGESLLNLAHQRINSANTREECDLAIALIKKAADLGYPKAQFELSKFGGWLGLDANQVLALRTKAANNGFIPAQRDLGIKAYEGFAGNCDFKEAIKWFSVADDLGDMESKCWLGIMHIEGKGFSKNQSLGHSLISWAAKNHCKKAHLELAYMYEFGTDLILIDTDKAEESFFQSMDVFGGGLDERTTKNSLLPVDEPIYPEEKKRWSGRWDEPIPRLKYERTVQNWWLPAAQRGYPEAQRQLANKCEELVRMDRPKIEQTREYWYRMSASQGYAPGQLDLARLLIDKSENILSSEEGFKWTWLSAKQGDCEAQCMLGQLYKQGQGVALSYESAKHWFTKAIASGSYDAAYELGLIYLLGQGVDADLTCAIQLMEKAAKNSVEGAQYELAILYYYAEESKNNKEKAAYWYSRITSRQEPTVVPMKERVNPSVILANIQEDVDWFLIAAVRGHSEAQYDLGLMYEANKIRDSEGRARKLVTLYTAASESGLADASYRLGLLYKKGKMSLQHEGLALNYFHIALSQGSAEAQACIVQMEGDQLLKKRASLSNRNILVVEDFESDPLNEEGSDAVYKRDYRRDVECLNKKARSGDTRAMYDLLLVYYRGVILEWGSHIQIPEFKNVGLAVEWASIIADQKNARGQLILGDLYRDGIGKKQDLVLAYKWYNCASYFGSMLGENHKRYLLKYMAHDEIIEAQELSYAFCHNLE
jgi:TPR repeat protein